MSMNTVRVYYQMYIMKKIRFLTEYPAVGNEANKSDEGGPFNCVWRV